MPTPSLHASLRSTSSHATVEHEPKINSETHGLIMFDCKKMLGLLCGPGLQTNPTTVASGFSHVQGAASPVVGMVLKFLDAAMQEDPELCLAAVNQNGYALQQPGWSW